MDNRNYTDWNNMAIEERGKNLQYLFFKEYSLFHSVFCLRAPHCGCGEKETGRFSILCVVSSLIYNCKNISFIPLNWPGLTNPSTVNIKQNYPRKASKFPVYMNVSVPVLWALKQSSCCCASGTLLYITVTLSRFYNDTDSTTRACSNGTSQLSLARILQV